MTPRAHLIAAGRALYGARWHAQLAAALDVGPRAVERWADGSRAPRDPVGLQSRLHALLVERRREIDDAMHALSIHPAPHLAPIADPEGKAAQDWHRDERNDAGAR